MRDFDWRILATIYKTKNITKASELLFITQPTLTRRLQQIEQEFEVTIVKRSNKGIVFTAEGEFLAKKSLEILDAMDSIKSYISSSKGELTGKLRLGTPNSYTNFVMPTLMEHFVQMYPNIEFDLTSDLSHILLKKVENGDLDVSFVRGDHDTYLKKELLARDQTYIFSKTPLYAEDLPKMPQISYTKETSIVNATKRWWQERYTDPPYIRFRMKNGESCLSFVKKGLGYAFFSDSHYYNPEDQLYCYPLTFLDGSTFTRNSWLVYNENNLSNPILSLFVDYVNENFKTLFPAHIETPDLRS